MVQLYNHKGRIKKAAGALQRRKTHQPRYREIGQGKKLDGLASQNKVGLESRQKGEMDGQTVDGSLGDERDFGLI